MLSIDQVVAWSPWAVQDVHDALTTRSAALEDFGYVVGSLRELPDWDGAASDDARAALTRIQDLFADLVSQAAVATDCVNDMIECVQGTQIRLKNQNMLDANSLVMQQNTIVDEASVIDDAIGRRLNAIGTGTFESSGHPPSYFEDLDRSNRSRLGAERLRLQAVADQLAAELDRNIFGGIFSNADVGLAQTRRRLSALDAIDNVLAKGNRQLLAFDNSVGERTLAAIAVGDVDTAEHIAVFIPGLNSSVDADIGRYDSDMSALREESAAALADTASTHTASTHTEPGTDFSETVAAVTWLDYDIPQVDWPPASSALDVVNAGSAIRAASRLDQFLDDVTAHRDDDPSITLLGHSYGSLTAAEAVRGAAGPAGGFARVDDLVVFGSPGLGISNLDTLAVPAGHVFVAESVSDPVADAAIFGFDPNQLEGVTNISADAQTDASGREFTASDGHSRYLAPGTTSLHNMGLIVAGLTDQVIEGDHSGWRDRLQTPIRW